MRDSKHVNLIYSLPINNANFNYFETTTGLNQEFRISILKPAFTGNGWLDIIVS